MRIAKRTIWLLVAALLILAPVTGCKMPEQTVESESSYTSYQDIPGVTQEEIDAITALQKQDRTFYYGMPLSTEAFIMGNGKIGGFASYFCEWLSNMFDLNIVPINCELEMLIGRLADGSVDFAGSLVATDERRQMYYMTDGIAQRSLRFFKLAHSQSLSEAWATRTIRIAVQKDSASGEQALAFLAEEGIQPIQLSSNYDAIKMLLSGEIDAFVHSNTTEAVFESYSEIVIEDFYPLTFTPVSLAAQRSELAAVISVVQKALDNDPSSQLSKMYSRGYQDYRRHKLYMQLTEDERAYIANNSLITVASDPSSYPASFFNIYDREWQGVTHDILAELGWITGISFEVANGENAAWPDIKAMLLEGKAHMATEVVRTPENEGLFILSKEVVLINNYGLISKSELRNIALDEIQHLSVALVANSAYAHMFCSWFPNHHNTVEYETWDEAFKSLETGEAEMLMASQHHVLYLANYLELSGYKMNFVFDYGSSSTFGFAPGQDELSSIIDKAILLVDTKSIIQQWTNKTYDYQKKLDEANRVFLMNIILAILVIAALFMLLSVRTIRQGNILDKLVKEKTVELQSQTEEAQAANKAKSNFLANMSHELRSPLHAVIGFTDLLLQEALPEKTIIDLQKIYTSADVLLGLVNDILDISSIEAGKMVLALTNYNSPSLLNDIINLNIIRKGEKPIEFVADINPQLPNTITGDDLRVKQIFNNLLSNAFKYTISGTVTLTVDHTAIGESIWLDIAVEDTGIGMKPEDVAKLFSEYNQVNTDANRNIEGTGLGLSITKRLVEAMEGQISVESVFGVGSVFKVRIKQGFVDDVPIGESVSSDLRNFKFVSTTKGHVSERLEHTDMSYARVLVVDDVGINLEIAQRHIGKYKIAVDTALSGLEAIELMDKGEQDYDAIFMDHMMPGMDGIEAVRRIRELGTEKALSVPIIALTANAIAGNEQMFLSKGFQAFMSKPIDLLQLEAILNEWVLSESPDNTA
ncbi:MAG: transporter substrate-binding domain-containing protein [Eubacteriaceae bacterium]|nr:transporter substrate-binding domain-containing protein [Eubacteriaceae bacterium]